MWGVIRRRVASGGSSASILGHSMQTARPARSASRVSPVAGKEEVHHPRGLGRAKF